MRRLIVPLMILVLAGCSWLDVASTAADVAFGNDDTGLSVDTELVIGDKKEDTTVEVGNSRVGVINNTADEIIYTETDYFLILLLILGWLLPSPSMMYQEVKRWFS